MTTVPIPCPCGATVHADTYPDGVTHTTVCECGRPVHVNVEVGE
jgi:hypothetical protein